MKLNACDELFLFAVIANREIQLNWSLCSCFISNHVCVRDADDDDELMMRHLLNFEFLEISFVSHIFQLKRILRSIPFQHLMTFDWIFYILCVHNHTLSTHKMIDLYGRLVSLANPRIRIDSDEAIHSIFSSRESWMNYIYWCVGKAQVCVNCIWRSKRNFCAKNNFHVIELWVRAQSERKKQNSNAETHFLSSFFSFWLWFVVAVVPLFAGVTWCH